ncbi:MAG TPA: hypothetical protein PKD28_00900 [Candidatus Saccharibacteria bacterium]|nr:hypothetical protein [Candidatus Saccharibacteria bacterium]
MTRYIAIDGKGGSGKTYLARLLAEKLQARLFHLDDYGDDYRPFIGIPTLRQLAGEATEDIVIYEGVGVFDDRLDDLRPFRVFVQVPEDIRHQRAKGRDVPRDDRTADDWKDIWEIWDKAEPEYFTDAIIQKADMIVGAEDGNFDVDVIAARFEPGN